MLLEMIGLIWPMSFVTFVTLFILGFVQYKLEKKEKFRKNIFALSCIFILLEIMLIFITLMVKKIYQLEIAIYVQYYYELLCYIILMIFGIKAFIRRKKHIVQQQKNDKSQDHLCIILLVISLLVGILCFGIAIASNKFYTLPSDQDGFIGNLYFNADVKRAVYDALKYRLPHTIHPCYRFILAPIYFIFQAVKCIMINMGMSSYKMDVIGSYYLNLIQIICNALAVVLFYKILKLCKIDKKLSFCMSILMILSLSSIWLSLFTETYAITLLLILLTIYLFIKKNTAWIIAGILVTTTNFFTGILILVLLMKRGWEYKKEIWNKIKESFIKYKKNKLMIILITFVLIILCFVGIFGINYISKYILEFSSNDLEISENIKRSLSLLISTWLIGPDFINISPYFVQVFSLSNIKGLFLVISVTIALLGVYKGRKSIVVILATIFLIVAYVLHIILGYGIYNSIIYTPLYSWAFITLIAFGINWILEHKNKKIAYCISGAIIICVMVCNVTWLLKFYQQLKLLTFVEGVKTLPTSMEFEVCGTPYTVSIIDNKTRMILENDGTVILEEIDGYRYNKEEKSITGNLKNSAWFKVYQKDNKLYKIVNGVEKEVLLVK